MTNPTDNKSRLLPVLREGVGVIQMIFFKELRTKIDAKHGVLQLEVRTKLAGAITNTIFGTNNEAKEFQDFNNAHKGLIEQELLSLAEDLPGLQNILTDALRIQVLCDHQEGQDSSQTLIQAQKWGVLTKEREIPLPSAFMESVRTLGAHHNLIIPPMDISDEDDKITIQ